MKLVWISHFLIRIDICVYGKKIELAIAIWI